MIFFFYLKRYKMDGLPVDSVDVTMFLFFGLFSWFWMVITFFLMIGAEYENNPKIEVIKQKIVDHINGGK